VKMKFFFTLKKDEEQATCNLCSTKLTSLLFVI